MSKIDSTIKVRKLAEYIIKNLEEAEGKQWWNPKRDTLGRRDALHKLPQVYLDQFRRLGVLSPVRHSLSPLIKRQSDLVGRQNPGAFNVYIVEDLERLRSWVENPPSLIELQRMQPEKNGLASPNTKPHPAQALVVLLDAIRGSSDPPKEAIEAIKQLTKFL